jgi:hypothetical protein
MGLIAPKEVWMNIYRMVLTLAICLGLAVLPAIAENGQEESGEALLRAAIFVQNRAGKAYQAKIDLLNDLISARLAELGFSVLDKQYVLDKFREARDLDADTKKLIESLSGGVISFNVEEALKDSSALRLAQMIGADYMIIATIASIGHTNKKFSGKGTMYGVNNEVTDYTLRVSLRVLEAAQGGSVYGDVVRVNERIPKSDSLEIVSSEIINSLLDSAADRIAANIDGQSSRIRAAKVEAVSYVPFKVAVQGPDSAVVELDGAAIGSIGSEPVEFMAPPGIHMMRVTRDWFIDWERPVNIQAGQVLNISMALSDAGIARFRDLEGFKAAMAIAKEKGEADEMGEYLISEGEKKKREESYVHIDTSEVDTLSVGGESNISNVDVKIEEKVK